MLLPQQSTLGPFKVDPAGHLAPTTPETFPNFAVRWRERRLAVRMSHRAQSAPSRGGLDFRIRLGRVPSSAGRASELRADALAAITNLSRQSALPWRFRLLPDHTVQLDAVVEIGMPISVFSLVTELALFLLGLDATLDALDRAGIRPTATLH
jgi:hypothetical protein